MADHQTNRFSPFSLDDLNAIRDALIRQLPQLAKNVAEERERPPQGASFDVLADAVRLIQELDDSIAAVEGRPLINIDQLKDVSSSEDLGKMYDQLPK